MDVVTRLSIGTTLYKGGTIVTEVFLREKKNELERRNKIFSFKALRFWEYKFIGYIWIELTDENWT